MTWRDMKSAPKDGTRILVAYPLFNIGNDTNVPDKWETMKTYYNGHGWDTGYWCLHEAPAVWCALPAFDHETKLVA